MKSLLFAVLLAIGCPTPPPPDPVPPGPAPAVSCVRACDHLLNALGCKASGCDELCTRVGDQRFTDCLAAATDCAAADRCDSR